MLRPALVALLAIAGIAHAAQPLLLQPDAWSNPAVVAKQAVAALSRPIVVVTDKSAPSPSGDAHDYVSYSRYWWPDPSKSDGLPYIRHDGHHNLEQVNKGDINRLEELCDTVEALAIGWARTGNADCAKRAGEWLRAWFINPKTRMNPSLDYSQIRPGHGGNKGTKSGVLDGRRLLRALDAVRILEGSGALSEDEEKAVRAWFADYYAWLKTSKLGREEAKSKNNHGTWSLVQELALAIHLGEKNDVAKLLKRGRALIDSQIKSDGTQPLEMARADGLSYCMFNLEAWVRVAILARAAGGELWNYTPKGGGDLKKAIEFLRPYNVAPQTWRGNQNAHVEAGFLDHVLAVAGRLEAAQQSE